MKSQFDFGTIIGLVAGLLCIFVSMIWPEVDEVILFYLQEILGVLNN